MQIPRTAQFPAFLESSCVAMLRREPVAVRRGVRADAEHCIQHTAFQYLRRRSLSRQLSALHQDDAVAVAQRVRQIVQNEISLSIQSCKQSDTRFCVLMLSMK